MAALSVVQIGLVCVLSACSGIAAEGDRPLYPPMSPPFRTLVENGTARSVIVLPPQPTAVHRLAADELRLYLRMMSGGELPIASPDAMPAGQFRLLLGREHPEAQGVGAQALKEEGFRLKTGDGYLVFAGQNDLGTLWAVYAFLEKHLGVRWFMPGELDEVAPRQETVAIGQLDETEEPDFVFRYVGANDWSRRNRMNGRLFIDEKRVGFNMWGGYHTFGQLLHPAKYGDQHPDWFPEINGERTKCSPAWAPPPNLCAATTRRGSRHLPTAAGASLVAAEIRSSCDCPRRSTWEKGVTPCAWWPKASTAGWTRSTGST